MSAESLKNLRTSCNVTQAEFAIAMGVPFRTYQDLEAGISQVRPIHLTAAKYAVIQLATVIDSGVMLPDDLRIMISKAVSNSEERLRRSGLPSMRTEAFEPLPSNFK